MRRIGKSEVLGFVSIFTFYAGILSSLIMSIMKNTGNLQLSWFWVAFPAVTVITIALIIIALSFFVFFGIIAMQIDYSSGCYEPPLDEAA